jgi:PKD repeat protein
MVKWINPSDTARIHLLTSPDADSKRVAAALDEVKVFPYCRNAEAIATEYANQFDPQTFYQCGPEISAISDFVGSPIAGVVDLSVQFTDLSVGNATSWLWDFGDGNGSSEQNPIHVYDDAGIYTVSLAVSGSIGGADTMIKTAYVTAYGVKVVANPLSGPVPLAVRFNSELTLP